MIDGISIPPALLGLCMAVFLLAGFVKGVIGMGLPTVAMGLLGLIMPPGEAAALLIVPSLVTNLCQVLAGPGLLPLLRRFWPMMSGICLGTWLGMGLLTGGEAGRATIALGAALLLYALVGLAMPRLRLPAGQEGWMSPITGAATGLVTAATGVFVLPAVPYMQALALDKDDLVQALGLSFTVSTLALAVNLIQADLFDLSSQAVTVCLALGAAILGMFAGQWLRGRISPAVFRRCFFFGLLLLGAHLALRGLF